MANRQTSINLNVSSSTDGFALSGGSTKRRLTVSKGDITLDGGSGNTYQFPPSSDTLVGEDSSQTLTNKQITGSFTGSGKILYSETASFAIAGIEGGGVTDHGALTGLDDDDHSAVYPGYGQTETISGAWTFSGAVSMSRAYMSDDLSIADEQGILSNDDPTYTYIKLTNTSYNWEIAARSHIHIIADANSTGPDHIAFYNPAATPVLIITPTQMTSSLDWYTTGDITGSSLRLIDSTFPAIMISAGEQLVNWCGNTASASAASVVWGSGSTPPSNVPTGTIYFQL